MIFELWDEEEAFLIDTYADMSDALYVVAATYLEHGESAVHDWHLLQSTASSETAVPIAQGRDLVRLAIKGHVLHSHGD